MSSSSLSEEKKLKLIKPKKANKNENQQFKTIRNFVTLLYTTTSIINSIFFRTTFFLPIYKIFVLELDYLEKTSNES